MINAKKEDLNRFCELLHSSVKRKAIQAGKENEEILLENRIFAVVGENPLIEPDKCAFRLQNEYGIPITSDEIVRILKRRRMAYPNERHALFQWANQVVDEFGKVIEGDKSSLEKFHKMRKEVVGEIGRRHESQDRICAVLIYQRFPEIAGEGDKDILYNLGNTMARYLFYDLCDALNEVYGVPRQRDFNGRDRKQKNFTSSSEQAKKEIEMLKNELERTNEMLSDLQNEFEEQLNESKIQEMTDFFAKLNSESYGCILDQLLSLRKGVDSLRKSGFEVPIEINGILIVIKKMWKFVTDSQIKPMWQPGTEVMVKASDVEFSNYVGSPFTSEDEEKCVKVISPGWIFKDKEVQISRPHLEEVKKDSVN